VRHRRHGQPRDEFTRALFMVYLDLDELPELFDGHWLWSARRPALAWFRRADHLGDPRTPLAQEVRELVCARTGSLPAGPVRLLTHLRYLGHCFNPVSFYFCFHEGGERLAAVVAEVTNTPWGERHAYVLAGEHARDHGSAEVLAGRAAKALHVSPLMGMEHDYRWRVSVPGERLSAHVASHSRDGACVFDATLALRRRALGARELALRLARRPAPTVGVLAAIYAHALRLRLRGASYHPHPAGPAAGA